VTRAGRLETPDAFHHARVEKASNVGAKSRRASLTRYHVMLEPGELRVLASVLYLRLSSLPISSVYSIGSNSFSLQALWEWLFTFLFSRGSYAKQYGNGLFFFALVASFWVCNTLSFSLSPFLPKL
jgi:hypothetical protein